MYSFLGHKHLLEGRMKPPEYPVFSSLGSYVETEGTVTVTNVPYPSTVNANDIILMVVSKTTWDYYISATGWTKITNRAYPHTHVFWKRATGSESGTVAVTLDSNAGDTRSYMAAYSGCIETGTPWTGLSTTSGSSTYIELGISYYSRHKAIGVYGAVINTSFSLYYSVPATERFERYGAPGSYFLEYDIPDDFATNPPTWATLRASTGGAREHSGIRFYLIPK
jgi:hypothetical protein